MEFVKHLPRNTAGKDYIVGDLHGCYDQLVAALKLINFDYDADRLFSVGDLVDRGQQNAECLGLLREPWFHAVRGNHEMLMLHGDVANIFKTIWMQNGGRWSLDFPNGTLDVWRMQIRSLPGVITVGSGKDRFNVVHAQPEHPAGTTILSDDDIDNTAGPENEAPLDRDIYWGRDFTTSPAKIPDLTNLSTTYVGHTSATELFRLGPIMYLDRGAVYFCNKCCLAIACHTDRVVHEYFHVSGELKTTAFDEIDDELLRWRSS